MHCAPRFPHPAENWVPRHPPAARPLGLILAQTSTCIPLKLVLTCFRAFLDSKRPLSASSPCLLVF
ncbi:predicted protein [Plenodomus lingam JN3]|uniref:Predicted protein n=1 Tax=Leptosphaeria maculans (strain JN3 / isolate v23.1.3 / race Av1-4-5-6-7-8) TaxID=985895 RepID=E5AFQ5_LEPMJ|nr:predicted protein [Plenodomus lingam JN3]CBY02044.1 predicted protein [Plenodomus lingam JN3]